MYNREETMEHLLEAISDAAFSYSGTNNENNLDYLAECESMARRFADIAEIIEESDDMDAIGLVKDYLLIKSGEYRKRRLELEKSYTDEP